jgi:hypothetical protein
MIHGAKDAYIGPEIARQLFGRAGEPKELWVVPGAKHNRCREVEADAYAARVENFLARYAPRSLTTEAHRQDQGKSPGPDAVAETEPGGVPAKPVAAAGRAARPAAAARADGLTASLSG